MLARRRFELTLVFGVALIHLIGFGIVIPVLPLYAERFGASPLAVGCLLGVYSAMQFIFAPLLGRISDRVGRRPVLFISMVGTALAFLLMGAAQSLWLLFAARILDGVTGGSISAASAYIADVTPPEERSKGMGLIGAAFGLGFIFGPAIGGLLSNVSLSAPFLFAAALSMANAVLVWFFLPESLPKELRARADPPPREQPLGGEIRGIRTILAAYFFTTMAFSLLTATYPLFTERRFGWAAAENGYIFAGLGLLSAVIQGGLLGFMIRLSGDKALAMAGTLILSASFFLLPVSFKTSFLVASTAGMAIGHSFVVSVLNGLASKAGNSASQGRILGVMQSAASLARVAGPVVGGWLLHLELIRGVEAVGTAPYWFGGLLSIVAFLLALAL